MNIAVIFAGGTGQRMNTRTKPKQFLELHGKPILVYTLEHFQRHELIDGIIVVCVQEWIPYCKELLERYCLTKVAEVVHGGDTGQTSIYHGLVCAKSIYEKNSVVLIHDGVRPLIDHDTITNAIECVKKYGSAITVSPAIETIAMKNENGEMGKIVDRSMCQIAKAPQGFYLEDILSAHQKAREEGRADFIDSACLMRHYGHMLHTVEGPIDNIKITTPSDFYIFRALEDARENSQIFGL